MEEQHIFSQRRHPEGSVFGENMREKVTVHPAVWLAGLAVLFLLLSVTVRDIKNGRTSFGDVVTGGLVQEMDTMIYKKYLPLFAYTYVEGNEYSRKENSDWLEKQIICMMPLYGYMQDMERAQRYGDGDEYLSVEQILAKEAQEGMWQEENPPVTEQNEDGMGVPNEITGEDVTDKTLEELMLAENTAATKSSVFVPHERVNPIDLQLWNNYETLIKSCYTIDQNTMAGSDQLDVSKLGSRDMTITKDGEGPQILIYHTHSQEMFADSTAGDVHTGIVGVGDHLTEILTTQYGYNVLHHTGQYDEARDDAYSNALPAIEQVLAENPSIQVVIDLHRDQMAEETRLVMDLDGRPTARFMFFNGLSRTRKTGNISYLYNENIDDNLAFSFQMQRTAMEYYPGLTRKIYLKGYRYNMHLRPKTLLIELGAQNNTVEEAMNACEPLAHILDLVLSGEAAE